MKSLCKGQGTQSCRIHYKLRNKYKLWMQWIVSIPILKIFAFNNIEVQAIPFQMATDDCRVIRESCSIIFSFSLDSNWVDIPVNKQP
jgi:hypothetical protein